MKEGKCISCIKGYYSFDINDKVCKKCPDNADCPGGSTIEPLEGFWR